MRCRQARRAIELRLDERLELEPGFELDRHLAGCADCRDLEARLQRVEDALLAQPEPPLEAVDVDAQVRAIRARLAAPEPAVASEAGVARRSPWPRVALAAAAALLLLLAWFRRGDEAQPPTTEPTVAGDAQPPTIDARPGREEPVEQPAPEREPTTEVAAQDPESLDPERLERARSQVRELLAAAAPGLDAEGEREAALVFVAAFEAEVAPLSTDGWPVERLVERLLDDPDPAVARAAARYLGLRGGLGSGARLARALDRPELAGAVVLALRDAGPEGVEGLGHALELPAQRERALELLLRSEPHEAASVLAGALERELRASTDDAGSRDLVEGLATLGPRGFDALFERSLAGDFGAGELSRLLADDPTAAEWALERLDAEPGLRNLEARIDLAEALAPRAVAPRLARMLADRGRRELALRRLPRVPGTATVETLLSVDANPRISTDELYGMVRAAIRFDPGRFATVAARLVDSGAVDEQDALAELIVACGDPGGVGALRELCASPRLRRDLGQELFLDLGSWGEAGDVELLLASFERFGPEDRHLAASCLLALAELGGDEALRRALEGADPATRAAALHHLRRRARHARPNPTIYRLARELEPFLDSRRIETPRSSS